LSSESRTVKFKPSSCVSFYSRNEIGTNQSFTKQFGIAMAEAFMAYDEGDYGKAVELANRKRYQLFQMGGSNAQRDVFHLFLLHAALKSDQPKHHKLARSVEFTSRMWTTD
jgi:hypothetical protein